MSGFTPGTLRKWLEEQLGPWLWENVSYDTAVIGLTDSLEAHADAWEASEKEKAQLHLDLLAAGGDKNSMQLVLAASQEELGELRTEGHLNDERIAAYEKRVRELEVERALQTEHSITSWLVDALVRRGFDVTAPGAERGGQG